MTTASYDAEASTGPVGVTSAPNPSANPVSVREESLWPIFALATYAGVVYPAGELTRLTIVANSGLSYLPMDTWAGRLFLAERGRG